MPPDNLGYFFLFLPNWIELNWWKSGFDFSESKVWLKIKARFHSPHLLYDVTRDTLCVCKTQHQLHKIYSHPWNPHSCKTCSVFWGAQSSLAGNKNPFQTLWSRVPAWLYLGLVCSQQTATSQMRNEKFWGQLSTMNFHSGSTQSHLEWVFLKHWYNEHIYSVQWP